MTEVNKERVALWVAYLRSGNFKQTEGTLRRVEQGTGEKRYCCLGVACELYENMTDLRVDFMNNGILPANVVAWFGFDRGNPTIATTVCCDDCGEEPVSASSANDGMGWTFEQIADALEKMYLTEETSKENTEASQ